MSATQQAKARRRQARNGYTHLAKIGRPIYKRKSATTLEKRLREQIEKERAIAMRKGMSKKK
ncbi:MAG: hypothetical protein KGL35_03340 [Bradyrhizobium sp.]|nr:hypothetical protein [Bradyrhizobium sp.]